MKYKIRLSEKAHKMISCYESFSKISKDMGLSYNAICGAIKGNGITMNVALNIMGYLRLKFEDCFEVSNGQR